MEVASARQDEVGTSSRIESSAGRQHPIESHVGTGTIDARPRSVSGGPGAYVTEVLGR